MTRSSVYLRKAGFAALVAAGLMALSAPAAADVSHLLGTWVNRDSHTRSITRVIVTRAGANRVRVRAFGQCHPADCDWGRVTAHSYFASVGSNRVRAVMARFNPGFARTTVILSDAPGARLRYQVLTHFTDSSGRHDYASNGWLRRVAGAPSPALAEDCNRFNPGAARVARRGGHWKIVDGAQWIADFGNKRHEARRALRIIRHYRFNRQCFVGRPGPSMTYWKRNNVVPSHGMAGNDCIGFNPATAHVAHVGGHWKIVDGAQWIADFGNRHGEANKAMAIIHRYRMNRQCFVGRPNPSMSYWLSR